jgi:hypothetical protein
LSVVTTLVSGSLGNVTFDNTAKITFIFEGDTDNVFAWGPLPAVINPIRGPVTGLENMMGVASVEITNAVSGALIAKGTFKPEAGIFVSVDQKNAGIGFGSFSVPLSDTAHFPGQPIYPYAVVALSNTPDLSTYDLKSDISVFGGVLSCIDFPTTTCGTPRALPTTAGDLYVNPAGVQIIYFGGPFTATVHPLTVFSSFHATASIYGSNPGSFSLAGKFTLGTASNGINPLAESVSFRFGTYSVTLPLGSFKTGEDGQFLFRGVVDGVQLRLEIIPTTANGYRIRAEAHGANLDGTTLPTTVVLTIGDDSGMTTAGTQHNDD